ncbi:MAG: hypothetical protein HMLKMBBP_03362 [Planctomycetes bacterium]|nr:hypothetical protein [Planctomycetota bacterium]
MVGPWVARRALLAEAANDLACLAAAWLRCRDRGVLSSDVSELEREVGRGPLRDPFTGRPSVMEFSECRVVLSSQGRLDGDPLADPEDVESHHLRWEISR